MKPYNPKAKCPRCGGEYIRRRLLASDNTVATATEYAQCGYCRAYWPEACLDELKEATP